MVSQSAYSIRSIILIFLLLLLIGCQSNIPSPTSSNQPVNQQTAPVVNSVVSSQPVCDNIQVPYQDIEVYQEQEPFTELVDKQQVLFDFGEYSISPLDRLAKSVYLQPDVSVDVSFRGDDKLNLWVMDDDEYSKVVSQATYNSDQFFLKRTEETSADASFRTVGADTYVFYLKNSNFFEKVAVYNFKAVARWKEQQTSYRTVEKTRTITRYKTEQRCE